jgi:hypothetical protein
MPDRQKWARRSPWAGSGAQRWLAVEVVGYPIVPTRNKRSTMKRTRARERPLRPAQRQGPNVNMGINLSGESRCGTPIRLLPAVIRNAVNIECGNYPPQDTMANLLTPGAMRTLMDAQAARWAG